MKQRPILFSTPMVQAILEGRKTQTRRTKGLDEINKNPFDWEFVGQSPQHDVPIPVGVGTPHQSWFQFSGVSNNSKTFIAQCPYGKPGDILWVRETWAKGLSSGLYYFKANGEKSQGTTKWKPSIHMPKDACRLFLKIKSIRVERLQDISEEDAKAEGVESWVNERLKSKPTIFKNYLQDDDAWYCSKAYTSFNTLWASINGQESWDSNPYVWVIEFEKTEKP